ncbi:hypothetical protein MBANPS3_000932 [Mucor bainieri]
MERLPSELRRQIFANVCNPEECLLVSKSWNAMITDDLLHRSAVMLSSKSRRYMYYEAHPDASRYVRDLYILTASSEKAFMLPRLFPNLQHLNLNLYSTEHAIHTEVQYRDQIESLDSIPHWTLSIASIRESNYSFPLFTSLWLEAAAAASETLANLTVLHVQMFDYSEFNKGRIIMQTFIARKHQFLHNLRLASALQHLTFEEMHISLQDLDAIHDGAPQLQSLSFINTTLRLNENAIYPYSNIDNMIEHTSNSFTNKQISNLKHFKIDLHSGKGLNGPQSHELVKFWMQQVVSKYIDLTSFTLQCNISMKSTNYNDEHTLSLLPMMASCQHLTAFKVILYPITRALLATMAQNNIKLQTIGFDTTNSTNLKQQLALLADSDQSNHIRRLEVQSNYPGGYYEYNQKRQLREELQPFDATLFQPLSTFAQLTTLEFDCSFGRSCELAHLLQILAYCKSLWSLSLHHASVSEEAPGEMQHPGTTNLLSRLEYLTITRLNIKRNSQTLVETNLILRSVLEGLRDSLRAIYLQFGSITFDQNKVEHPQADYVHLDLSKLHRLRELCVHYTLGTSIITTKRGDLCETHEFSRNNRKFTKMPPPAGTFHYQTKVILPQQAVKINTLN